MTQPSDTYLQATNDDVHHRMAQLQPPETNEPDYPQQALAWKTVADHVDELRAELVALADDLHAHPELAFDEHRSAEAVATAVEKHGFTVTRGAFGLATGLHSEWATPNYRAGDPTIAVMAEYDALPGIGHACGHNIIAASAVGAYLSAVNALRAHGGRARVVFLGTPAEEGHSGKEYMIRAGMLDGIDAAVMMHPFSFDVASHTWVGRRTLQVEFDGIAAHASSQPFMGRNALDAASLAYQGIGLMRQQMPPSDRVHATMAGGQRPSIIPKDARLDLYVRSLLTESLVELSGRIDDIVTGAALMAGVDVRREWDVHPMTLPIRNNQVMAHRWARTQAHRCRLPLPKDVLPDTLAASTDFGNVSHLVPGIHPMVKVAPEGVALHTEEFARFSTGEGAAAGIVDSAVGLAQVIVDLVNDPALLQAAKDEFTATGGARKVSDLLAAAQGQN